MSIKINPQHSLSLKFLDHHEELNDEIKTELIEELAKLIFQLWKAENEPKKIEDSTNE